MHDGDQAQDDPGAKPAQRVTTRALPLAEERQQDQSLQEAFGEAKGVAGEQERIG